MTTETITDNRCRLHNAESNVTRLSSGNVVQLQPKKHQQLPSRDKNLDHLDRWARFSGHAKDGGVIVAMN